jgi:osmotically inducible lipoprotein OsmB
MRRKLILACGLTGTLVLAGCAGMSETEQRTLSGGAIGTAAGVAVGAITGEWAWAAGGAAIGAASGYLYDQQKKKEQHAYEQGVQQGKKEATQK